MCQSVVNLVMEGRGRRERRGEGIDHVGKFGFRLMKVYPGGTIDMEGHLDPDFMALIELDFLARKLGYAPNVGYYYRLPHFSKLPTEAFACVQIFFHRTHLLRFSSYFL